MDARDAFLTMLFIYHTITFTVEIILRTLNPKCINIMVYVRPSKHFLLCQGEAYAHDCVCTIHNSFCSGDLPDAWWCSGDAALSLVGKCMQPREHETSPLLGFCQRS